MSDNVSNKMLKNVCFFLFLGNLFVRFDVSSP